MTSITAAGSASTTIEDVVCSAIGIPGLEPSAGRPSVGCERTGQRPPRRQR